ncbi:ead/Ea22-like family protein [Klebsiella pneumoniae]|uniref:ead/Ea22-like family protein n=1 Tax=Klebsiella pneumoniae TaxID=573 RepID=UPI000E52CFB3|nr:ead/Ea22-like family protein [Klebsiella pneumoniae]RHH64435.1 ead/Ea22-like family protein [Klebsiella pneumoniae]
MTDITELAQSHELLIANGQQTADLLRHLADNEIDSDYFAVVSECESYGQETDAELSITEFALRAAVYVDELVDALEKAQQRIDELENDEVRQRLANAERQLYMAELAKHNLKASRKAQFRKRRAAEKRIGELEREQEQLRPVGVMSEQAFHRLENRECRFIALWPRPGIFLQRKRPEDGVIVYARTAAAAGIKVEAE